MRTWFGIEFSKTIRTPPAAATKTKGSYTLLAQNDSCLSTCTVDDSDFMAHKTKESINLEDIHSYEVSWECLNTFIFNRLS